jgi:hypothetical protein
MEAIYSSETSVDYNGLHRIIFHGKELCYAGLADALVFTLVTQTHLCWQTAQFLVLI